MNTEDQIIQKIAELKAYSMVQNAATGALFAPLEEAIAAYYASVRSDISAACEDVVKYMYNDIVRRTTIYEHFFDAALPTDFPAGYADLGDCFTDAGIILSTANNVFYAAFVYAPDPVTSISGPVSNSYINIWASLFTEAKTKDKARLDNLAEWCKNSGGSSDVIDLLEDKGEEISSKNREEIAAIIYLDKNLLEIINTLGLTTYIPSYMNGGG